MHEITHSALVIDFAVAATLIASLAVSQIVLLRRSSKKAAEFDELSEDLRKRAEQSESVERESSGKLESILSVVEDAILSVDHNGICSALNKGGRDLFPSAEPQTLLSLSQSADLDNLLRSAIRADDKSLPVAGEVQLRYPRTRTMQVLISRVGSTQESHNSGTPPRPVMLLVLRDITDLRRLETVRRDFVANVSHELRTPLSSIMAMAETLRDGAIDDVEVARHFLDTIVHEANRLVRLAEDLLDLSQVEGRPVLKSETDLSTLIDDVVMRLASQRSRAGLSLAVDIERPLLVLCDRDEVAQVLVNLLDNAIKYTPRGGIIEIRAHLRKGRVTVEVSDTGIGILQQDLPRLFERFYRTDKARSRASGGTGLGLAIVKHIVERHGGELWVKSEYNRGSTFGFSLPRESMGTANRLNQVRQVLPAKLASAENPPALANEPDGLRR